MGGIGKSTLAAQIAARVSRLQSERVITVVNGEVPASAPWPAEADFVVLDNFDDNLSQESGRWTVRDPALAALLAGWTGKLLITCGTRSAWARPPRAASRSAGSMFGDLFGRLGTTARSLLIRASVFRVPVTAEALGARPGPIAECEAAGLLVIAPGHELVVHRWTAGALHRQLAEAGLGAQLAAAHRQAAAYWLSRGASSPESGYHQRRAAELTRVAGPAPRPGPSLRRRGAVLALAAVSVALAVEAGRALAVPHLASAEGPAGAQLLRARRITVTPSARSALAAGQVDAPC